MNRFIISVFIFFAIISCKKSTDINKHKSQIRSKLYITIGPGSDTIFQYYLYDSLNRYTSSILKLNSTNSPLDGYDSIFYSFNEIEEHYKFLNQKHKYNFYLHSGTNLVDSITALDLNTNDNGKMIFFRSNNNYPDSMHFEYLISNLLIKKTLFFFYENDELSELHTYNDGDVRLFDYKLKFYYHPTFKYKNGVDDTEYFITSYILYGFSKNTVCNIGIVSTHLLDRYDYFGDLNDSIPSLPHQYNYIEYSPLQIIATSSNYKYIYNFSN